MITGANLPEPCKLMIPIITPVTMNPYPLMLARYRKATAHKAQKLKTVVVRQEGVYLITERSDSPNGQVNFHGNIISPTQNKVDSFI